jgi:hypothetical protein
VDGFPGAPRADSRSIQRVGHILPRHRISGARQNEQAGQPGPDRDARGQQPGPAS